MNIRFNFYPSSGGNVIYTINVVKDILVIKRNSLIESEKLYFERILTDEELKELIQICHKIKPSENVTTEIVFDSWRIELVIDGKRYYNKSCVKIKNLPNDISKLFHLLIKESTIDIDLYGFS
jgi:hypothetical protein